MPPLTNRPPKLCHHKALNLAIVYVNGKQVYLGAYDGNPKYISKEVREAYNKVVAKWATGSSIT